MALQACVAFSLRASQVTDIQVTSTQVESALSTAFSSLRTRGDLCNVTTCGTGRAPSISLSSIPAQCARVYVSVLDGTPSFSLHITGSTIMYPGEFLTVGSERSVSWVADACVGSPVVMTLTDNIGLQTALTFNISSSSDISCLGQEILASADICHAQADHSVGSFSSSTSQSLPSTTITRSRSGSEPIPFEPGVSLGLFIGLPVGFTVLLLLGFICWPCARRLRRGEGVLDPESIPHYVERARTRLRRQRTLLDWPPAYNQRADSTAVLDRPPSYTSSTSSLSESESRLEHGHGLRVEHCRMESLAVVPLILGHAEPDPEPNLLPTPFDLSLYAEPPPVSPTRGMHSEGVTGDHAVPAGLRPNTPRPGSVVTTVDPP
ncbi:hypothetical protein C8Q80DRAFT_321375 [Daedaleopsis nitida]|nr:hypothetical protein C8Q80DRAFT_321375 [Daedaleopsis nitida]